MDIYNVISVKGGNNLGPNEVMGYCKQQIGYYLIYGAGGYPTKFAYYNTNGSPVTFDVASTDYSGTHYVAEGSVAGLATFGATIALRTNGSTFTRSTTLSDLTVPSDFWCRVRWTIEISGSDLTNYGGTRLHGALANTLQSYCEMESIGVVYSGGETNRTCTNSGSFVGTDYVAIATTTFPTGDTLTGIGTIRIRNSAGSILLEHAVTSFDKPGEVELIIEYRSTIT